MLGLAQLTIDNAQASDERAQVNTGRFSNTVCNFDGGLFQNAEGGFRIHATDAMLL